MSTRPSADSAAPLSRDVFVTAAIGALACIPFALAYECGSHLALPMQFALVITMVRAAPRSLEQMRVSGDRRGARPAIALGSPREADGNRHRVVRICAALAMSACGIHLLAVIAWVAN